MAATGKTPILLYGSTTATNQPSAGNLTNSSDGCEIAINVADKNLFFKDATNTVNTVPIRQSSASSNGWLSSTDWSTFNSKQPAGSYALTTGTLAQFASTTSAQLAGVISDETGSGSLVFGTSPTISSPTISSGNLIFGTTAQRITGDMSSAATSRLAFQSSTTNGASTLEVIPNGTGTATALVLETDSALTNGQYVQIFANGATDARIVAGIRGTGTYVPLCIYSGGSEVTRFFTSGGVSIGNTTDPGAANLSVSGNVVIATSGKGIDFSATAGTGTSELLADYEEGTWTPSVSDGTNSVTGSTTKYTKTGRTVVCEFLFYNKNISGLGTGALTITGLPFTATGNNNVIIGSITSNDPIMCSPNGGATTCNLYATTSGANLNVLTKSAFASATTASLWGTIIYNV